MTLSKEIQEVKIKVERIEEFKKTDLQDLCDATEATISDNSLSFNIGFNRTEPQVRERLQAYWRGVLLVPNRELFVGRLDGIIASSIQLEKPAQSNQTQFFSGTIDNHFVAPWARGHGLAKELLYLAEQQAKSYGLKVLKLSVRETALAAISLYESMGYQCWGTLNKYEVVDGKMLAGNFYYKEI